MSFYNKNQKVIILLLRPVFFQDFYDAVVIIGRGCETADFLEFGVSACHCVAVVRMPQQFTVVEIIAESHCLIWRNAEFLLQKFDCRAFADTFLHNVNPMLSGKGNVEMRKMFQHKRINAGFGVFEIIDGDFSDTVLSNSFGKIGYGFEAPQRIGKESGRLCSKAAVILKISAEGIACP